MSLIYSNELLQNLNNKIDDRLYELIIDKMDSDEQKQFVESFKIYLQYGDDDKKFIIDFDEVWKWVGFSQKVNAKRLLTKKFTQNINFIFYKGLFLKEEPIKQGENEIILLNVSTFKKFCMTASTKRADEICDYYLKMENIMHQYTKEKMIEYEKKIKKYIEVDKDTETFWDENSISYYDNKNVVYIAYIGVYNNEHLYKFGKSEQVYTREFDQHQKTFEIFKMKHIELCDNMSFVEKEFKKELKSKNLLRTFEINSKNLTELFTITSLIDINKLIQNLKELVDRNPLQIIKDSRNEIEKNKIIYENDKLNLQMDKLNIEIKYLKRENEIIKEEYTELKIEYKDLKQEFKSNKKFRNDNNTDTIQELEEKYFQQINTFKINEEEYIQKIKNLEDINLKQNNTLNDLKINNEEYIQKNKELKDKIINQDKIINSINNKEFIQKNKELEDKNIEQDNYIFTINEKTIELEDKIKELEDKNIEQDNTINEQNTTIDKLRLKGLDFFAHNDDEIQSIEGNHIKCKNIDEFCSKFIEKGEDTRENVYRIKTINLFNFYKQKCDNPLSLIPFNNYIKEKYNIISKNVQLSYEHKINWIGIKFINIIIPENKFNTILQKFINEKCIIDQKLNVRTKIFHDFFKDFCIQNDFIPHKGNGWSEKKCRIYIENNGFSHTKIGTNKCLYNGLTIKNLTYNN
jgi:hypothetical protein